MSWFRTLLANNDMIARLKADCDSRSTHITELKTELEASEARLYAEIAANREREDALVAQIVTLAGGDERDVPLRRRQFAAADRQDGDKVLEAGQIEPVDMEFEKQVEDRAKEFADAAKARGIQYRPEDLEILKEKIRREPSEYLEN